MQCPNCRLINPDNAVRCDCGYDFGSGVVKESYLVKEFRRRHPDTAVWLRESARRDYKMAAICLLAGIIVTVGSYFLRVRSRGAYMVFYGPVVYGVFMLARGVRRMKSAREVLSSNHRAK
jgi:hypothetical protein